MLTQEDFEVSDRNICQESSCDRAVKKMKLKVLKLEAINKS